MIPKATGGLRGTAPKEPDVLSQDEGEVSSPGEEGASTTVAGKEVTEEKVTGTPDCEGDKKAREKIAVYPSSKTADISLL